MTIRRSLCNLFTVALFVLISCTVNSQELNVNPTSKLQPFLNDLSNYSAFTMRFTQKAENITAGQVIKSQGLVRIEKPDKFCWTYESNPQNTLVSDGKMVMLVVPSDKHSMVEPIDHQSQFWSPLQILVSPNKLLQEFRVIVNQTEKNQYILNPVQPSDLYQSITLQIFKSFPTPNFELIIIDQAGNRNTLSFSHFTEAKLGSIHLPVIPDGYEITDFSGQPALFKNNIEPTINVTQKDVK